MVQWWLTGRASDDEERMSYYYGDFYTDKPGERENKSKYISG